MNHRKIAVIVGSLRRDSINRRLAVGLTRLAPPDVTFTDVPIGDLPLYNHDDEATPEPSVLRLRATIRAADGLLFVTPEYNRSIPGVLKNAIDHASRPYGQSVFTGKPAAVVGAASGALGTALAQQHLRNILAFLDMPTLGQPEVFIQAKDDLFEPSGDIGPVSREFLQGFMNRFLAFVDRHAQAKIPA